MFTVCGNWLDRIDNNKENLNDLEDRYEMSLSEIKEKYNFKHLHSWENEETIIFLEGYCGEDNGERDINCIMKLKEGEELKLITDRDYLGSDCDMFLQLWRDGKMIAEWVVENSPIVQLEEELLEYEDDINFNIIYRHAEYLLLSKDVELEDIKLNKENTVFIKQS